MPLFVSPPFDTSITIFISFFHIVKRYVSQGQDQGISKEIKESYIKDSEKTSIWDELEKKSLGIKVPVSNDKNIEFNKSNFPDYGLELYRFSFDRESHYLVTSQNVSYFINGISHDHKVYAKCSRKWF